MKAPALILFAAATMATLGAQTPATKEDPPKAETCVVSGEKLGESGEPHVFSYKGREIKVCCKKCQTAFEKSPAKYLKKLQEKK